MLVAGAAEMLINIYLAKIELREVRNGKHQDETACTYVIAIMLCLFFVIRYNLTDMLHVFV